MKASCLQNATRVTDAGSFNFENLQTNLII